MIAIDEKIKSSVLGDTKSYMPAGELWADQLRETSTALTAQILDQQSSHNGCFITKTWIISHQTALQLDSKANDKKSWVTAPPTNQPNKIHNKAAAFNLHFYSENENGEEAIKNKKRASFLLGLLRLLVLILDDPGVDGLRVVGDNLSDQTLGQKLPQGLSCEWPSNLEKNLLWSPCAEEKSQPNFF